MILKYRTIKTKKILIGFILNIMNISILIMSNIKSKLSIVWSMRKWSLKYIDWRLTTAYPEGWLFILKHPIVFIQDIYKYLVWCQKFDRDNDA